jgi:murein L,D-transpeptidase YafK
MQVKTQRMLPFLVSSACLVAGLGSYAWWPASQVSTSPLADKVLVLKSQHKIILYHNGEEICRYGVAIGRSPVGPKTRGGDHRTPEGNYVLDRKNPKSGFHLAMHVSYPNSLDRDRAAKAGLAPGGDIMVHGIKNGLGWLGRFHRLIDWTDGCIAITNPEMDQFWKLVPEGTPIEIRP